MNLGIRAILYSARKWKKTLLVFCLLYTPCIAAVASVKREMGGRWATVMVVNQCVVAWLAALIVRFLAVAVL